ncbi:MAG: hypothetical protein FWE45_03525 [Firmicutes bacterium]|nr:hypothetical protein [Bacillota bacterium]
MVWDQVQDIIDAEMAFSDFKPSKLFQKAVDNVLLLDEYVTRYSHTPPQRGEYSVYKGKNVGRVFGNRKRESAALHTKAMLKGYEKYPNFDDFQFMYNVACLEDYIKEYGHLPRKRELRKNIDIGNLWSSRNDENSSALKQDLLSSYEDVVSYKEFCNIYNAACLEDYIMTYGHLPNALGGEHKDVDIGVLVRNMESAEISEGYRKLLSDIIKDVPMYSERERGTQ